MNRGIGSLLLVLALQCALVAIVYWPQAPTDNGSAQTMLPFDPHQVSELHIGDEFDNETVLQKVGERWLLPELEGLPANAAMVEALMQAMGTTNGGWPVADTVAARQRFRVASYHYRRRIRLLDENSTVLSVYTHHCL